MKPTDKRLIFPLPEPEIEWEVMPLKKNILSGYRKKGKAATVAFRRHESGHIYMNITLGHATVEALGWPADTLVKVSRNMKAGALKIEPDASSDGRKMTKQKNSSSRIISMSHGMDGQPIPSHEPKAEIRGDILYLTEVKFPYKPGDPA